MTQDVVNTWITGQQAIADKVLNQAYDAVGNLGEARFTITVVFSDDVTPPTLTVPDDITLTIKTDETAAGTPADSTGKFEEIPHFCYRVHISRLHVHWNKRTEF